MHYQFYSLEISEDGFVGIWKYQDDQYTPLLEWAAIDLPPSPVAITIGCVDDSFALAVNGEIVADIYDTTGSVIWTGDVGLLAATYENGGLSVSFDNFGVYPAE